MNYTKGNWKVYQDGMRAVTDVVAEDGIGFFQKTLAHIKNCDTAKETDANAQLIASAPDLYEVAKIALDLVKTVLYNHPDDDIAQAQKEVIEKAIAKVEGK